MYRISHNSPYGFPFGERARDGLFSPITDLGRAEGQQGGDRRPKDLPKNGDGNGPSWGLWTVTDLHITQIEHNITIISAKMIQNGESLWEINYNMTTLKTELGGRKNTFLFRTWTWIIHGECVVGGMVTSMKYRSCLMLIQDSCRF